MELKETNDLVTHLKVNFPQGAHSRMHEKAREVRWEGGEEGEFSSLSFDMKKFIRTLERRSANGENVRKIGGF